MESRVKSNSQLRRADCFGKVDGQLQRSPSVIVIGGGMAGVAAARALHDASIQVVLLESRERLGGRIHTDYSFGFPVDLGASWLHGVCKENPLAPLIGRLGLPLYRTSEDNSVLYDHDLESYALFDMDGIQVPQELVKKVGKVFEMILEETDKVRQELSEDISILQALSIVFERKPEFRGLPTRCSSGICAEWRVGLLQIRIPYHSNVGIRVSKIERRYNGVKVTVENGETFIADAAVVAVPLGVLKAKSIKFEPKLPDWKEAAIADLGVGIENKIILHFENVFWPNVEFLGVVAETSYGCSYFLNLHKAAGHPVLVYMPAGRLAKDIEKMSDEAAANFAFMQLKKILPDASSPIQYLVSRWGTDVNSLGSYSYDAVGKPHDLYERLRVPVDNLFFAGEATSALYPGSVHGAFSTAMMAAEDCRMRVLERYGELDLFQPVMGEEALSIPLLISRL
ncbi:hypothetical protein Ahy_A07g031440 isoform C [Arachis hypogaea]|uniref:Amine oxidase domain-containing protein n=1 Tax=Arachis hypogaea TaxID=3818 RepID=A0A445C3Y7_ARAHY|nr:hypothetical protein Ahy_A07g031440 isoform C [Arachis hypogaea]